MKTLTGWFSFLCFTLWQQLTMEESFLTWFRSKSSRDPNSNRFIGRWNCIIIQPKSNTTEVSLYTNRTVNSSQRHTGPFVQRYLSSKRMGYIRSWIRPFCTLRTQARTPTYMGESFRLAAIPARKIFCTITAKRRNIRLNLSLLDESEQQLQDIFLACS